MEDTAGNGGMYGGIHAVGDVRLTDVLNVTSDHVPTAFVSAATKLSDMLLFNFKLPVDSIEGILKTKLYNPLNNEVAFEKSENIIIGNGADLTYSITEK